MKHHEYQIYYGGFKIKIPYKYCKICGIFTNTKRNNKIHKKQQSNNVSIKFVKVTPLLREARRARYLKAIF